MRIISSKSVKNVSETENLLPNSPEKHSPKCSAAANGSALAFWSKSGGILENSFSPIPPKTAAKLAKKASVMPIILGWNRFWSKPVYEFRYLKWGFDNCSYNCVYTEDRKLELLALAVIFHGGQSLGELPKQRKPEQLFTLMTHESPHLCYPNLANLPANYFNISITYHANSTIHIPYEQFNAITSQTAKEEIWSEDEIMKRMGLKRQLALQIVSHCDASSGRDRLIEQLQQLMPLEVFGRCNQKPCDNNYYQQQLGSHFFYMAFENSVCPQYVTEKFWNALRSLAVPVVLSRSALKGTGIPDEVYIAADDFGSVKELADYLKALRNDTDRYLGYLKWTKKYRKQWDHNTKPTALCQLCEILYKQRLKEEFRSYAVQLDEFWGEKTCRKNFVQNELFNLDKND